jgi:hypothetical protein
MRFKIEHNSDKSSVLNNFVERFEHLDGPWQGLDGEGNREFDSTRQFELSKNGKPPIP